MFIHILIRLGKNIFKSQNIISPKLYDIMELIQGKMKY